MKIAINTDAIGQNIDQLVEQYLAQEALPTCFGNMIPPIIVRTITVEDTEMFKPKGSISADKIFMEHIEDCVVGKEEKEIIKKTDLVLTKDAAEEIQEWKKSRAEKYVQQLVLCHNCNIMEVCYRLTTNYLKFIEVEGQYKKGGRR